MKNAIRNATLQDFKTIRKWWEAWEDRVPKLEELPNNGLGGLILERDGKSIEVSFPFLTNSKMGYVGYLVRDPKIEPTKAEQKMLAEASIQKLKSFGCTRVFFMTNLDHGIALMKELGFTMSEKVFSYGEGRLS